MGKRLGWSWDPSSAFRENESKKESKKEKIKKTSARSEDSPRKVSRKTLETEIMINLGHSVINLDNLFYSNHWVVHSCISKFHKAIWSRCAFKVLYSIVWLLFDFSIEVRPVESWTYVSAMVVFRENYVIQIRQTNWDKGSIIFD